MSRSTLPLHKAQSYKHLLDFSQKLESISTLTKTQSELIKIRSSQLNGCAYCLDLHIKDALKAGEKQQRINVVSAWREVPNFFTAEEQAILALTEELTLISQRHGVSDGAYNKVKELLGEEKLGDVIMQISEINAWNRLAITCKFQPTLTRE